MYQFAPKYLQNLQDIVLSYLASVDNQTEAEKNQSILLKNV